MDDLELARHAAAIADVGYTVVEHAIEDDLVEATAENIDRLQRELEPIAENANTVVKGLALAGRTSKVSGRDHDWVRIDDLLLHGQLYERIPVHPSVLPVAEQVLGPELLLSWLMSSNQYPGAIAQRMHCDDELYPLPRPHPPLICNTLWALTDFTVENGATRVVPGSHHWAELPGDGPYPDGDPVEMSKGSVLIWHGSLWHNAPANHSSAERPAITMNYCAGFLRQQVNQQLSLPPELVRTFEPRLQALVGYGMFSGKIGRINWRAPAPTLDSDRDGRWARIQAHRSQLQRTGSPA
jgi:ectoine hydroxylase-related dioxygenase (phytanoyl-CoA dioxygenase family)